MTSLFARPQPLTRYCPAPDPADADDGFAHIGELLNFTYEEVYDGFMEWNENVTATLPLMVSVGKRVRAIAEPQPVRNPCIA